MRSFFINFRIWKYKLRRKINLTVNAFNVSLSLVVHSFAIQKIRTLKGFDMSLRALICDPEKSSRSRFSDFLSQIPMVEQSTAVGSTADLPDLLAAKKINVLFIDPFTSELNATSKLIFRIRQDFPQVIVCLLIRPGEVRRRTAEFYDGERERFGHYFKLNKDLPDDSFQEDAYLMLSHCYEAVRRLTLRSGRIQLTIHPRFMDAEARVNRFSSAMPQHAREKASPAGVTVTLPARSFPSALPGLGGLAGQARLSK